MTRRRARRREPVSQPGNQRSANDERFRDGRIELNESGTATAARRERERHWCPSCVPWDRAKDPEVVAACMVVAAGGVIVLHAHSGEVGRLIASVLVALGVVRLGVRLVRARLRHRRRRDLPLLLGVDPRVRRIRVTERITTRATLDDDLRYTTEVAGTRGTLKVDAQWGRAQAHRLEDLRRRHRLPIGTDRTWSAGYLVLRGRPQVAPRADASIEIVSPTVLRLTARDSDHPALSSFSTRADARWTIDASYDVAPDRDPGRFMVWLVPTVVPRGGRRSLDLEVHWRSLGERRYERGPNMHKLDLVRIRVPGRWGPLEDWSASDAARGQTHPAPMVARPDQEGLRTIEWRNVPVAPDDRGRHCLQLRFADAVDLADGELLARVEARFQGALSGLDDVGVYHAGGAPRSEPSGTLEAHGRAIRAAPSTVVELDARLRLAGLRYEDVLSLPPRSGREARELSLAHSYPTTVPGHATVSRLADELSHAGYYVKRVVENPPRAGGRALTMNHSWNLGGRFYDGVYPIDFDLGLDGEETDVGGQVSGSTSATLHIRGAYTTDTMKQRVVSEWTTLWNHIDVALSGLRRGDGTIGLPDVGTPAVDLEEIFALVQEGIRHGGISETFAEKLMALLRPTGTGDEEAP